MNESATTVSYVGAGLKPAPTTKRTDLPEGWQIMSLKEVAEINPKIDKSKIADDTIVSFIPMQAVGAGDGRIDTSIKKHFADVKKGYTPFQPHDVLFAKITPCMENGKIAVVPALHNNLGFGSTEFHVIRHKDGVDPQYIYYYVSRLDYRKEAASKMTEAVGQKRVPTDFIKSSTIPLAPLDQQKLIIAEIEKQFSRLDEAVAALKRIQANLKRYKASVLKAAVEGKLTEEWRSRRGVLQYAPTKDETGADLLKRILTERRKKWEEDYVKKYIGAHDYEPNDDSWKKKYREPDVPDISNLPKLPKGWIWSTVDQLSIVVRGASPRPAGNPKYFGGTIPWITVGPITADEQPYLHSVPNTVTEAGRERSRYIVPQTLLLTNSGATLGVPKVTLIGGCINDGVAALLDVDYPIKLYLLYFLRTQTERLRGINQGAAQPNLNTTIIKAIFVPLPPVAEQQQIVAEVENRLSVTEEGEITIEMNLKRAERLRQSILKKAFSGKLVLKNHKDTTLHI